MIVVQPLAPTLTAHLFAPLHDELLRLLRGLDPADWERPTVAGSWRVRDVAAHLLDGDLRALSILRDGHLPPPAEPFEAGDDLVRFLDRLNADWVAAAKRLSPRVLIELLAVTGPAVAGVVSTLPPYGPALFPVAWTGEERSPNWMHIGRDYTERWHHQMQIRDAVGGDAVGGDAVGGDAVGASELLDPRWLHPLLDLSLRALPHAYRDVAAEPGTALVVAVSGGGGSWSLVRRGAQWQLCTDAVPSPATTIRLDPDTAWRSLYNALQPAAARSRAQIDGNQALAQPFFATRSVMVRDPGGKR